MEGLSGFYEGQQVAVLDKKWLAVTSGSFPVRSRTQVLQHHTSADNHYNWGLSERFWSLWRRPKLTLVRYWLFCCCFSVRIFYTLFYTTVLSYLLNGHECRSQIVKIICAIVHHGAFFISDIFNLYEVRGNFGLLDVFFQSKRCYYHSLSLHTCSPYNHFPSMVIFAPLTAQSKKIKWNSNNNIQYTGHDSWMLFKWEMQMPNRKCKKSTVIRSALHSNIFADLVTVSTTKSVRHDFSKKLFRVFYCGYFCSPGSEK